MDAERALLSQILQDNDVYYRHLPQEWWFIDPRNRNLFSNIQQLIQDGVKADQVSVGMKTDALYTSEVAEVATSTSNSAYYAGICRENGSVAQFKALGRILQEGSDITEMLETTNETIEKVVTGTDDYKIQNVADLLIDVVNDLEERYKRKGQLPGIKTEFTMLDDYIGGLQKEKLIIIGARPSQGKSAIALNMAGNISKEQPVGFISLESSYKEVIIREIASVAKINSQNLASGFFSEADFNKLTKAAGDLSERVTYIYDKPNCRLEEVIAQARIMRQKGVEVIFIDYLQLIQCDAETDRERVSKASKRIKDLARELHIPIVALAQLRRDSDGRRPTLGDFQHTSQIEQDADVAMNLYHRVVNKESGKSLQKSKIEDENTEDLQIYLLIDKNRDGRTGAVELDFDPEYLTFKEKS